MPHLPSSSRGAGITLVRERVARLWGGAGSGSDGLGFGIKLPELPELPELPALPALPALPDTVRGGRLALDSRALAGLLVLALGGAGLAGWFALRGSAQVQPVARTSVVATGAAVAATSSPSSSRSAGAGDGPSSAMLVVDVAGRVRHAGLVRVPPGSRVADALTAAGGVLPGVDLTTINLARPVVDGEQVVVGVPGAGGSGPAGAGGTGSAPDGPLDLNAATLEQLESLPDVGPVLAQRILDWRTAHGRFSTVDELREVGGIGARKYADIAPKVRV